MVATNSQKSSTLIRNIGSDVRTSPEEDHFSPLGMETYHLFGGFVSTAIGVDLLWHVRIVRNVVSKNSPLLLFLCLAPLHFIIVTLVACLSTH